MHFATRARMVTNDPKKVSSYPNASRLAGFSPHGSATENSSLIFRKCARGCNHWALRYESPTGTRMLAGEDELKAWMLGSLDGDARSHRALLRALVPKLRAFYRSRLADRDEIEDLLQETLIAVHTRRTAFDRRRAFSPWLFAIAKYKLTDHFRRARPTVAIDELENELSCESFEEVIAARLDIDRLLDELPAKQAQAIGTSRLEGYSIADTA